MSEIVYKEKQKTYLIFYVILVTIIVVQALTIAVQIMVSKADPGKTNSVAFSIFLMIAFILILYNFFYMRIFITKKEFIVSYGVFHLKLPINEIKKCEPTTFSWKTYLGWGIRAGSDHTTAWTAKGNKGIMLQTKKRAYVVSTDNAQEICRILQK